MGVASIIHPPSLSVPLHPSTPPNYIGKATKIIGNVAPQNLLLSLPSYSFTSLVFLLGILVSTPSPGQSLALLRTSVNAGKVEGMSHIRSCMCEYCTVTVHMGLENIDDGQGSTAYRPPYRRVTYLPFPLNPFDAR